MTTTVRAAIDEDRARLAQLVQEWAQAEGAPNETGFAERCAELDLTLAAVAEVDGRIVGVARAVVVPELPWPGGAPWGYVDALYVQPAHREAGLGRALLALVAERAREAGCRLLRVTSSDAARPVYQAAGFREQPRAMVRRLTD